jgi:hypothetical protein
MHSGFCEARPTIGTTPLTTTIGTTTTTTTTTTYDDYDDNPYYAVYEEPVETKTVEPDQPVEPIQGPVTRSLLCSLTIKSSAC